MALIFVDFKPPHLQRLPLHLHKPFKFVERFHREKAEVLDLAGTGADIDDEHVPTHPLDPRAHFVVRLPDDDEARVRREIAAWTRERFKPEMEAASDFLEALTVGLRFLSRAFAGTPAGPVLGVIVEGADILDDVPEVVAGDLDVLEDMIGRAVRLVERAERDRGTTPTGTLSERLRALRG